ncbi:MAG: response regulator, partial [Deltaproteobacteria bacterium]|nr:response regulator [Deltaproteobacteria bacterium]
MLVVRDWFPEENWLKTMEKHWKSNPVIVAVDDVVEDLWALDALLEKDGYGDVSLVDDFSRAMDRIRSQNPDLLMVSLSAFCGRGIELVDQIARDPYLKGIPVVALSSPSDNGLRARASALGVVEILPKPYDAVETSLRLRNVLRVKAFQDFLQDENRIVEEIYGAKRARQEV